MGLDAEEVQAMAAAMQRSDAALKPPQVAGVLRARRANAANAAAANAAPATPATPARERSAAADLDLGLTTPVRFAAVAPDSARPPRPSSWVDSDWFQSEV